jgi:N-acetylneuraminic acid mutarotase
MKSFRLSALVIAFSGLLFAASETKFDSLPAPTSGSAVTTLKVGTHVLVFSMMGMGAGKTWDAVSNSAYVLNTSYGKWSEVRAIPGAAGRLGAVAAGLREQVFLIGGYALDAQGLGNTVSSVDVYSPFQKLWYRGPDLPKPVSNAVAGVYRDRYIYVVGGRSKADPIRDVQVYDTEKQEWLQGTALPGTPVFGHAGALVGDTIIYVDGAEKSTAADQPKYIASDECWMGKIQRHDPTKIEWTKLPAHPGMARYGVAAGGSEKDQRVYFSGGSDNPYDSKGIGFDGKPSEPSPVTFAFNLRENKWETITESTPDPSMSSGLVVTPGKLLIIGGLQKSQQVTARVAELPKSKAK